ncbi:MAG: hypothetical protein NTZ80_00785 [Patescibacteria group bacterium]|nr:hypothetical protein [Patescibacteria group bacterium]
MIPLNFLQKFRISLIEDGNPVSNIEMTSDNYDDFNNPIKTEIPTVTTDICEIGIFNDTLYLVAIVFSSTFKKVEFDSLKIFPNIKIYGFKEFKKNLYPTSDFVYKDFEEKILDDKYLQIQFNYKYSAISLLDLFRKYKQIKDFFTNSRLRVVNQLNSEIADLEG